MKRLMLFLLLPFCVWAQNKPTYYENGNLKSEEKVRNDSIINYYYFENGQLSKEAYFNSDGTFIGYKHWNDKGVLVENRDLVKERMEKGPNDLSFIKWSDLNTPAIYMVPVERDIKKQKPAEKGSVIVFNYICMDDKGYEYDNSIANKKPLRMVVGDSPFLDSFSDYLAKMNIGDQAYIRIPPAFGYGNKPAGNVPPNTTLVYYAEILDITK